MRALILFGAFAIMQLVVVRASGPDWWVNRGVISGSAADDYAVVNTGQLKHIATKAVAELDEKVPGGAGRRLHSLINSWSALPQGNLVRDDYASVNVGQLKNISRLFYDRLKDEGVVSDYPWINSVNAPDDFALANIGQVKYLFAFDFSSLDSDNDGLLDYWEISNFANLDQDATGDFDHDWLFNGEEYRLGTSPSDYDTDGDGFDDYSEVNYYHTDPRSSDTDGDGLPDDWEIYWGTDPLVDDAFLDSDNDGLTNLYEYIYGTFPIYADSDGDGLLDGEEVNHWLTDPQLQDSDWDGLSDGDEVSIYGTDPLDLDTDNDTLNDHYEVRFRLNPLIADILTEDLDNDGLSLEEEMQSLTDPDDPDTDKDGLLDGYEVKISHTSPVDFDSDGDGLDDKWEIDNALNPNQWNNPEDDDDFDGLGVRAEYMNGTNPSMNDSDGDSVDDGDELAQGSDPSNASDGGQAPLPEQLVTVQIRVANRGKDLVARCADCHSTKLSLGNFSVKTDNVQTASERSEERLVQIIVGRVYDLAVTDQRFSNSLVSGDPVVSGAVYDATVEIAESASRISGDEVSAVTGLVITQLKSAVVQESQVGVNKPQAGLKKVDEKTFVPGPLFEIYEPGVATPVMKERWVNRGAFTVANLNDTDGDELIDKDDTDVSASTNGRDEVDLIRLVLKKPYDGEADLDLSAYKLKLKLVSGKAAFWSTSKKGAQIMVTETGLDIPASELPKTIYLEATAVSENLRDIVVQGDFVKGSEVLRKDSFKVTGIWSSVSFRQSGVLSSDNNGEPNGGLAALFASAGGALGNSGYLSSNGGSIKNSMEMQFTLLPAGVGQVSGIFYDVSRRAESRHFSYDDSTAAPVAFLADSWRNYSRPEVGTDDVGAGTEDETNIPSNDHVYGWDAPGLRDLGVSNKYRFVSAINAQEFLRISFVAFDLQYPETELGSRASSYGHWYSRIDITKTGTSWSRTPGSDWKNEISVGFRVIPAPPQQVP